MGQHTKGKCKYCGKEYTFSYMNKHLPVCEARLKQWAEETGRKQCGHLSAFEIDGIRYEVDAGYGYGWQEESKSMNYKLKTVLRKGMTLDYEYDFGSTTELMMAGVFCVRSVPEPMNAGKKCC